MDEKANREYNDGVFRLLFNDESRAAELYNAISGTNYTADAITINTIQNPLFYGDIRNDLSFSVEDKFIILVEHQSSINPNIGLRCLLYVADIYEKLIDKDGVYKAKPMSIENPEFYVMYNGKAGFPEKAVVKLSDLFKIKDDKEPALELVVTVYNVNHGRNKDIMTHSKTLDDYAMFIAKAREYEHSEMNSTEALQRAVEHCMRNGILSKFLRQNGGRIVKILQREWNWDDAKRVWKEEAKEDRSEEIAKKMLKRGTPIDIIVEDTELTEKRILSGIP